MALSAVWKAFTGQDSRRAKEALKASAQTSPEVFSPFLHDLRNCLFARTPTRDGRPPTAEEAKIATLTPREREVIALVGQGLRNKQIAQRLALSENTVRRDLASIFRKLGVIERLNLILYAYRHGLARIPL